MDEIVVGVDGSAGAAAALRWAADAARRSGARLVAVHAYRMPLAFAGAEVDPEVFVPDLRRAAEALLAHALQEAGPVLEGLTVEQRVVGRGAAAALLEASAKADLLVVGARGAEGFRGLLLGSVSDQCALHAACPVVVVPGSWRGHSGPVVVGVDDSERAYAALRWAGEQAAALHADVTVVQAYRPYPPHLTYGAEYMELVAPASEEQLREQAAEALESALTAVSAEQWPVRIHRRIEAGAAAQVLVEASEQASLLVVGSRGLGGFSGLLLGSVSRQCLHHAACPVAVVHPSPTQDKAPT